MIILLTVTHSVEPKSKKASLPVCAFSKKKNDKSIYSRFCGEKQKFAAPLRACRALYLHTFVFKATKLSFGFPCKSAALIILFILSWRVT